jgi:hypothetical protein
MPTYITEWDGSRNALVEVVVNDWLESITDTPTVVNLGDTLLTASRSETVNTSPLTVTTTQTVVLF